ncbi:MAG: hypothetical protein ACQGVK_12170 [Myxococcota bacterium]
MNDSVEPRTAGRVAKRAGPRAPRGAAPGDEPAKGSGSGPFARTVEVLGPVAGGVALDLLDLASFGPIGVYGGLLLGGFFGWWLSGVYRMPESRRRWVALGSGLYCAFPFTEVLPLATIASVIARLAGIGGSSGRGE